MNSFTTDAYLVLENGDIFKGKSFGAKSQTQGEMVFQTGMVGYTESITDPSYTNQILVLTYPLVGNYGIPDDSIVDNNGLPMFLESSKVHLQALIVGEYVDQMSHCMAHVTLHNYLVKYNVPGIFGIDTRQLTILLRKNGSMNGKIVYDLSEAKGVIELQPLVKVTTKDVRMCYPTNTWQTRSSTNVLAIDCGIKYSQIRCMTKRNATVKLVPWDYDITNVELIEPGSVTHLFISNGPGDPQDYQILITRLSQFMKLYPNTIIFGICLGHQILALASGAKTYKMKYGNRGHNIPCGYKKHNETKRCFITSQNHGYAVDTETLSNDWDVLFTNLNDLSNEGIYHKTMPWWSCQFHPESNAGPRDTEWLFDCFLYGKLECEYNPVLTGSANPDSASNAASNASSLSRITPKKILLLGSGGLSIGQSGEFDYSGSQAIKAFKESGITVVLVNPNIATVQTTPGLADEVYFVPITPEYVEKVIERERPDYIALSFGGQTALNCGVILNDTGILEKYNIKILGTPLNAIKDTEDRKKFKDRMEKIGGRLAEGVIVTDYNAAVAAVKKMGYPVLIRAAYALGGLGSGFAYNDSELHNILTIAFANSPQVTIDESLKGWKELEYEIVRDQYDNCISVCNMENIDPLGIHTGESIVVAPSQTLNDHEYQSLRDIAFKAVRELGIVGECNIQYAVNPNPPGPPGSMDVRIIEINARLSRSSALASKATGYPLAYIAAKLGLGYSLTELKNAVTNSTCACFEPSLDYCVVKVPRWDLAKFPMVSTKIDSSMKSIGESMAVSRSFEEAFQKAFRMANPSLLGFEPGMLECTDDELTFPSYKRMLAVAEGLYSGKYSVESMHQLSKIDRWFLHKFNKIVTMRRSLEKTELTYKILRNAKRLGFSDAQIANANGVTDLKVRDLRKTFNITPFVKQIDTVSGEFPSVTNYLYMTYSATKHDTEFGTESVVVLGSGVYTIGSSVEFDWCAVGCIRELRKLGKNVIVINCNPETVSTDYDEADKLYFDELSFETVMDVHDIEKVEGIVVSMGGQIANNIALKLHHQNVNIIGTQAEMIDRAENRYHFSRMLKSINVDQPEWENAVSSDKAREFCNRVGYPCLVRPSYVLSGAAMRVVFNDKDLDECLSNAKDVSNKHPVVVSKFICDAKEIEVDAVAKDGIVKLRAISEHVENAGVHSGDATLILPAQDLTESTLEKIKESVDKIAKNLKINGPFNIQFIAKDDQVKVIECNVRVSRSFPFVSKTLGIDFIKIATRLMCGVNVDTLLASSTECVGNGRIGVKVPQFSFNRLPGAEILLDVEMQSTGEVACFGENKYEAYLKGLIASGFKLPKAGGVIVLSIGSFKVKTEFIDCVSALIEMGFKLYGTHGTADFYNEHSLKVEEMTLYSKDETNQNTIAKMINQRKIDLIVNVSEKNKMRCINTDYTDGYQLRRSAIESSIPIMTDIKCAKLLVNSLQHTNCYSSASGLKLKTNIDSFAAFTTIRIPGLIDVHVHVREPGHEHKEDYTSCTQAALAGGITAICAMPNTNPPICDPDALALVSRLAEQKACCDYALFVGASSTNYDSVYKLANKAAALKLYLNATFGPLLLKDTSIWMKHIAAWPDATRPICVHAEAETLPGILYVAALCKKKIHVCHVARKAEIEIIKHTKLTGLMDITCEVAPHHLFMTMDECGLNANLSEVRPMLLSNEDVQALWDNMSIIDCFATDHAPHLVCEKESKCCPGFPGLETALPLLLTAVNDGRLTIEDIILRYHTNPKRIFHLPDQENTYVEIELNRHHVIPERTKFSKCGWTPFAGKKVVGMVKRVVLRGDVVFVDGNVIAKPGSGKNLRTLNRRATERGYDENISDSVIVVVPGATNSNTVDTPLGSHGPYIASNNLFDSVIQGHSANRELNLSGILSVDQFTKNHLRCIFDEADTLRELAFTAKDFVLNLCKGKIMAELFYEPSTRTKSSFHAAMLRLGGNVIPLNAEDTSVQKGETIEDFVRCMEQYCDITVLRSSESNYIQKAASVTRKPLINAGNGADEHPTQALLDVYTIRKELGTVNGLTIAIVGDLKHGRTAHSLAKLLALYDVKLMYVSPKSLRMPKDIIDHIKKCAPDVLQTEYRSVSDVIQFADVIYMTRVQKERFDSASHFENVKDSYTITPAILAQGKQSVSVMMSGEPPLPIVMHPLPRNNEISVEIDTDPRAAYFRQMENGMYVRMALLNLMLNK